MSANNSAAPFAVALKTVLIALALVLSGCLGGCPYDDPPPNESYMAKTRRYGYKLTSSLRGQGVRRCTGDGAECSVQEGVDCGTCEDGSIIPELSPIVTLALKEGPEVRQSVQGRRAVIVGDGAAEVLDLVTEAVVEKIELTGFGVRVAVSDDGRYAAVRVSASGGNHAVDVIDLQSLQLTDTAALPPGCAARDLAFLPGTHDVYVACQDEGTLRRISVADGTAGESSAVVVGCTDARGVAFTADGQRGLLTCTDSVWVYDLAAESVAWEIPGFENAVQVATRLSGTRAYVHDRLASGGYRLVTVDLATYDWLAETPLDGFPADLFVAESPLAVYSLTGGTLHVADADGAVQTSTPTPAFSLGIMVADLPPSDSPAP